MLYSEDKTIKLGGIVLPGLVKKFDVKSSAIIEEVEVEGSAVKPKQAVGYEDCKISIELIIDDTSNESASDKIQTIQKLFHASNQSKPQPLAIVSTEASIANVNQVLFKDFNYNKGNKVDQYAVSIELWEYIPMTITAVKSGSSTVAQPPVMNEDFSMYLDGRGSAPKPKISRTPAVETRPAIKKLSSRGF